MYGCVDVEMRRERGNILARKHLEDTKIYFSRSKIEIFLAAKITVVNIFSGLIK